MEWCDLPKMITERRAGVRRELESERLRREALEKEKQEAERIAVQKKNEEVREQLRREQVRKQAEAQRNTKLQELRSRFQSDFLGADVFFQESCTGLITEQEFGAEKLSFVKAWIKPRSAGDFYVMPHVNGSSTTQSVASKLIPWR